MQYSVEATSILGVSTSAARGKDGKIWLALVNTNPGQAVDIALDVSRLSTRWRQFLRAASSRSLSRLHQTEPHLLVWTVPRMLVISGRAPCRVFVSLEN